MISPTERQRRFLQTLWQNRLFETDALVLTDGTPFEIINSGVRNGSGENLPDFSFAAIHFPENNVTLHGSIKIDTHSSHWREQGTVNAPEYSSVILHVVYSQDVILGQSSRDIPTFVLRPPATVATHYDSLRKGVICACYLGQMDTIKSHHLLTRIMSDRLARKSDEVLAIFESTGRDWHETAYICFVRAFGYREKKLAFETLARTLPLRFLRLHSDSISKLEALILGQAGYLDVSATDDYTRRLQREYAELSHHHGLHPRQISWRGAAVRPGSLPVQSLVRIAAILKEEELFLDRILQADSCDELVSVFDILLSEYWQTHLAPSRLAAMNSSGMTRQKSELLIINFVIPFLIAYGIFTGNDQIRERAIDLYESLPPEDNRYTRQWAGGGYAASNAFFSQALIQLSSEYCAEGVCGGCPVGANYLREKFAQQE